jgi:3-hydroxymyristoyl/3-hydroxydecanoyl-(acyl carrier protein) dehydratase
MNAKKIIQGTFYFDPNDPVYQVHFPSFPVVPGSLIIDSFIKAIKKNDTLPPSLTIQSFKFIQFAKPGLARYEIKIFDNQSHCFLFQNQTMIARGQFKYET